MDKEPTVKREGASGRLLETVEALLAKGKSVKEVSEWTRVNDKFVQGVKKKMSARSAKK